MSSISREEIGSNINYLFRHKKKMLIQSINKQLELYRPAEKIELRKKINGELDRLLCDVMLYIENIVDDKIFNLPEDMSKDNIMDVFIYIINSTYDKTISIQQLKHLGRRKEFVRVKYYMYYALRVYCKWTLKSIALAFNSKDHTNVIYGINKIYDIQYDKKEVERKEFIDKNIKLYLEDKELGISN